MILWEECKPKFKNITAQELEAAEKSNDEQSFRIRLEVDRLVDSHLEKISALLSSGIKKCKVTIDLSDAKNPIEEKALMLTFETIFKELRRVKKERENHN